MEAQLEDIFVWLAARDAATLFLALALAAALEYVFPPAPGDALSLLGIFLASGAGFHPAVTYLALMAGAVGGSLVPYAVGRSLPAAPGAAPRWLGGATSARLVRRVVTGFAQHGSAYLALNRFLPALRSVFFVAAGLARLPLKQVLLWGTVSAAVWNGILVAAGVGIGAHWRRLAGMLNMYTVIVLSVLAAAVLVAALVRRPWKRGRRRSPS